MRRVGSEVSSRLLFLWRSLLSFLDEITFSDVGWPSALVSPGQSWLLRSSASDWLSLHRKTIKFYGECLIISFFLIVFNHTTAENHFKNFSVLVEERLTVAVMCFTISFLQLSTTPVIGSFHDVGQNVRYFISWYNESCFFCFSTPFSSLFVLFFLLSLHAHIWTRHISSKFPPCWILVSGKSHHFAVIPYSFQGSNKKIKRSLDDIPTLQM